MLKRGVSKRCSYEIFVGGDEKHEKTKIKICVGDKKGLTFTYYPYYTYYTYYTSYPYSFVLQEDEFAATPTTPTPPPTPYSLLLVVQNDEIKVRDQQRFALLHLREVVAGSYG